MNNPKNILIVRTDRIGDVVLSLPMAGIIKKHFPDCKVTFMLREYTKPLAVNNPDIDEIITLKEEENKISVIENMRQVKERNFDTCFVVHPTFRIALFLFLAGIKNRVGTGYRFYSFLFNKKIFIHRKEGTDHELKHNVNMLQSIGINENVYTDSVPFNIHPSENSKHFIEDFYSENLLDRNLKTVIIHPGSGGSSVDWPLDSFIRLTELMAHELNINIFITGSTKEYDICSRLAVHRKVCNLAGKFELPELIALINSADLLIANSTGPIHIAGALGKHVAGFYPKINHCSQKRWGPFTNKKIIFEPEICEGPCSKKQCEELNCMNSIKAEDVFNKIKKLLNEFETEK